MGREIRYNFCSFGRTQISVTDFLLDKCQSFCEGIVRRSGFGIHAVFPINVIDATFKTNLVDFLSI